mmetsp:Transcript_26181/g.87699  ORF Transcript_26181/g.87699 Transcript_26181/m.87699 type:complete len:300 (-) Transcript_26181:213-1112(-)
MAGSARSSSRRYEEAPGTPELWSRSEHRKSRATLRGTGVSASVSASVSVCTISWDASARSRQKAMASFTRARDAVRPRRMASRSSRSSSERSRLPACARVGDVRARCQRSKVRGEARRRARGLGARRIEHAPGASPERHAPAQGSGRPPSLAAASATPSARAVADLGARATGCGCGSAHGPGPSGHLGPGPSWPPGWRLGCAADDPTPGSGCHPASANRGLDWGSAGGPMAGPGLGMGSGSSCVRSAHGGPLICHGRPGRGSARRPAVAHAGVCACARRSGSGSGFGPGLGPGCGCGCG